VTTVSTLTLAPDPALPDRDLLLDPAVMLPLFTRLAPEAVSCRLFKAKYRIGESFRVLYRVELPAGETLISARLAVPGRLEAARCWRFPDDRKIPHLGALLEPPPRVLAALGASWRENRLVSYAPGRAGTARCHGANGQVLGYLKAFAGREAAESFRLHRTVAELVRTHAPSLVVPDAIAYDPERELVLLTPVAGEPLAALGGEIGVEGFGRLGAALARLHGLPVFAAGPFRRLDAGRMSGAAELLARARPDLAVPARALARRLGARVPIGAEPPVCLHGDVNSRNWLIADGSVGLIDLDQLGLGPAAADLGGALATVQYRARTDRWPVSARRSVSESLLRGYALVRRLPATDSLRWHAAAALLVERALRAVTRVRPAGLAHLEELLEAADALLDGRDDD